MYYLVRDETDPELPFSVFYDSRDGYPKLFGRYMDREQASAAIHYLHGGNLRDMASAA